MAEEIFKVEDIITDIKKLTKDIKNGDVNIREEFEKFTGDNLATGKAIGPKIYTKQIDIDIDIDEWMDTFNRKGEEPTSEDFSDMLQYVHDHFVKSNLSNGVVEALSCIEFFNIRDREIIHKIIDNNYNIAVKRSLIDFDKNIYTVNIILMVPHAMSGLNFGLINKNERSHDDVLNSINIIKNRFSSDEEDDVEPDEEDNKGILESYTWKEIAEAIKDGTFSNFASVGDTKSFIMNGKTYHAEVVSINDGSGEAGKWYPNKTVDFITKELYETNYPYNSTDTNTGGFPYSELRGTLENTLYPLLPSDLKDVIIKKTHSYITHIGGVMCIDSTKLWLPTFYEIAGTTSTYAPGETSSNNKAYTLASKIKTVNGESSASLWWLGSLNSYNSMYFWCVGSSGIVGGNYASCSFGVPLCFRIGEVSEKG